MVATVARIAAAVDLPVTADLEAAYDDPAGTAAGAVEAGAVGVNFEDATYRDDEPLVDTMTQADWIWPSAWPVKRRCPTRDQRPHRRLPRTGW